MRAGRERRWDVMLNGVGYLAMRENGVPVWRTDAIPELANQALTLSEQERRYSSLHGGFGHSHYLAPDTYHYAVAMDATRPRQLIMGPLVTTFAANAAVTGFFEQQSALYVLGGQYAQQVNLSTDLCETPNGAGAGKDFGSGTTTVAVNFDSLVHVFFSSSTNAWTFDTEPDPDTWTQANTNSIKGSYGARFWSENAGAYVLARSYTDGSGNPVVAWLSQGGTFDSTNWSAAYVVGDKTKAVTGLAADHRMLWVAKRDGLYYIDGRTGRSIRVIEPYPVDDNNGVGLFVDSGGRVYYPALSGLLRYDPNSGEVVEITPGRGLGNASPIYGRVTALRQYKGSLYAAVYNGTDSYLMVGREREAGEFGFGPLVWHGALARTAAGQITAMWVTGLTSPPRLYWGDDDGNVSYIRLPAGAENPLQDSGYRYAASGSLYLPADNMGTPGTRWALAGLVIENDGLNSTTYCSIYALLDNGSYQFVGNAQASGRCWVPIPSTGDWRFSNLALRLDFTNPSNTSSPKIRAVSVRAAQRLAVRDLIQTTLHCSERAFDHYGVQSRLTGAEQLAALQGLCTEGAVTLSDWWTGSKRDRRVFVMPVREMLVAEQGWAEAASGAEVRMACLSSETVQVEQPSGVLWGQFNWNDGSRWS